MAQILKKSISLERLKISSFRLKFSISLENFNLAWNFQSWPWEFPTKIGVWWVARLKCSISLENVIRFNLAWKFQSRAQILNFSRFGPSGNHAIRIVRFQGRFRHLLEAIRMAILNRFSAILLDCDSVLFFCLSLRNFRRLQARDSGNRAIRGSRFCAANVLGFGCSPSGVAKGLLHGRPLQLARGWGVGEELNKSWPNFEQLCVQNLGLAISCCVSPTTSAYKIRLARSWPRVEDHGLPTFDSNISVLKLQGSFLW